jgi:alkaline phosphatase
MKHKLLSGNAILGMTAAAMIGAVAPQAAIAERTKNLILMIGDGMGPQQIGLLELYAREAPDSKYNGNPTAITKFSDEGILGFSLTNPHDALVVDSACSASHLALGIDAPLEAVGIDANGDPYETILEMAQRLGKSTGLVSDTRITHATPAAFAAHQPHRSLENEIAVDMLGVGPDVMLSGGLRYFVPASVNDKGDAYEALKERTGGGFRLSSKRKDERNLLEEAENLDYTVVHTLNQMNDAQDDGKLLGLFANSAMMDGIAYSRSANEPGREQPSLREMTMKALDILSQDEDGFFLLVEAGQIDWASHNNDPGTLLHELLRFDEAIEYVYEWVQGRDDTVVVVTADHETGGFGFSYSIADLHEPTELPGSVYAGRSFDRNFDYARKEILSKLYKQSDDWFGLWLGFLRKDKADQTPENLMELVNSHSEFKIDLEDAKAIMAKQPNPYFSEGHVFAGQETLPKIADYQAFYMVTLGTHAALISRQMADQTNITWATGGHTHTPVNVIAWGPEETIDPFSGALHHVEVGALMKDIISGE